MRFNLPISSNGECVHPPIACRYRRAETLSAVIQKRVLSATLNFRTRRVAGLLATRGWDQRPVIVVHKTGRIFFYLFHKGSGYRQYLRTSHVAYADEFQRSGMEMSPAPGGLEAGEIVVLPDRWPVFE